MPKNNTIIHKSFSKKDLLKIIDEFNITIGVGEQHMKSVVANTLWDILLNMNYLEIPKDNKYLIKDLYELRKYLKNQNPRKPFSVKDREKHIMIAKKITHYCHHGFSIDESLYTELKYIYDDADKIAPYGDIPIVRKAIKLLMNDPKKLYKVTPIISSHVQHDIDIKRSLNKKSCIMRCHVKRGKFIIKFD